MYGLFKRSGQAALLSLAAVFSALLLSNASSTAISAPSSKKADAAQTAVKNARRYQSLGKYNEAVGWFDDAAADYEAAGMRQKEAETLTALAAVHETAGRFQMALDCNQRSMQIDSDLHDTRSVAVDEFNVGRDLAKLGEAQKAQAAYLRCAQLFADIKDTPDEIVHLDDAAGYSEAQGDYATAMDCRQRALIAARDTNALSDQQRQLDRIAGIYEAIKQPDNALDYRNQSLQLARALNSIPAEASELCALGRLQDALGKPQQALITHEHALGLAAFLKNGSMIARALASIADDYGRLGQPDKAIQYRKMAVSSHLAVKDSLAAIYQLEDLVQFNQAHGDAGQAARVCSQAAALCKKLTDGPAKADQFLKLGQLYQGLSMLDPAMDCYQQALSAARGPGGMDAARQALDAIGDLYSAKGITAKFLAFHQQALKIDRSLKDPVAQSKDLAGMGSVYASLHNYSKALECYSQALSLIPGPEHRDARLLVLRGMGYVYRRMGVSGKSAEQYRQALAIDQETQKTADSAVDTDNLGETAAMQGDSRAALDCFLNAISLFHEAGDPPGTDQARVHAGLAYAALGEYASSMDILSAAAPLLTDKDDAALRRDAFDALSSDYAATGQYIAAAKNRREALNLSEQLGDKSAVLDSFYLLGDDFARAEDDDQAIRIDENLCDRARRNGSPRIIARAYDAVGAIAAHGGQYDSAALWYARAWRLQQNAGDHAGLAVTFGHLMTLCSAWGQPRLAIVFGKEALKQLPGASNAAALPAILKVTDEQICETYRELAALLLDQQRIPEAVDAVGGMKLVELASFSRRGAGDSAGQIAVNPEEADAFVAAYSLMMQAAAASEQRVATDVPLLASSTAVSLRGAQDACRQYFTKGAALILSDAKVRSAVRLAEIAAAVDRLRKSVARLGGRTAVVDVVLGADCRFIVITPAAVSAEELGTPASDLSAMAQKWRAQLMNPDVDPRPLGARLYRAVFGPIKTDLQASQATTILWSLDGALRYVPVGALYGDGRYLAEEYRNVILPGASIAAVGQVKHRDWYVLGAAVTRPYADMPARVRSVDELNGIIVGSRGAGALPGKFCVDNDFTRDHFLSELATGYPVVHIACPVGLGATVASSFVVDGSGAPCTLESIFASPNLLQSVDLLTLSACRVDLAGQGGSGSEIEGLEMEARSEGASSTLLSLWTPPELSSRQFMNWFYLEHSKSPNPGIAAALQNAQIAMIRGTSGAAADAPTAPPLPAADNAPFLAPEDAPYAHPFYWASFQLAGAFD